MRKGFVLLFYSFILSHGFGQKQRKISTYLLADYNKALYDYTINNNPWGAGLGLQFFLNNNTMPKPVLDITGDIFLEDDKVLRLNPDGSYPQNNNTVGSMINLFAGSSFHPANTIYFAFTTGPSLINGHLFFGIKPAFGFHLAKSKKWTGKASYINVFNRTKITKEDFGLLSLAIGFRLF